MTMRIDESETYVDDTQRVMHDDGPFTGEAEYRGEDGELLELTTYYDGIPNGPQEEYYPGGQVKSRGENHMGMAVGEWHEWHPDGKLAAHRTFSANGWPLHVKEWDADGVLVRDEKLG
ncbi:hypothetical protein IOD16_27340 [Saccharothrix sp. 6-C]|uniref:toxin-antitoxin system YwqK family antitoxin n=1 Tax=Saccharothrix TaxID=2071 RepID=UPI000F4BB84E|nr:MULTISPECIES: hypothetical protein [Saccharothrix]QQQ74825.1 hypothetical protein IOD16_27340 [Saccharothrix sp. 6-C]